MKKYKRPPAWRGFIYFLRCRLRGRPNLVNIEVTKRCNAKCNFCSYWNEDGPPELDSYVEVVKAFRPVVLSLSGGEPLIRRNLHEIIREFRPYCHYVTMVTNGTLLTEERAIELFDAGVNHLSVSLDFLSERHDELRGVPGLYKKIAKIVPDLASKGFNISLNTVIMGTNLDQIIPIAKKAEEWGVGVSYSTYCHLKNDNYDHTMLGEHDEKLIAVIKELKELKKFGHIKNSNYYLDKIPEFVSNGGISNCRAGKNWVQVTPDGYLQPCSELPKYCHFTEYKSVKLPEITCTKCWFACRGEAEANPLAPDRLKELIKS